MQTVTKYGVGVIVKNLEFGYKLVFHSSRRWFFMAKVSEIPQLEYKG